MNDKSKGFAIWINELFYRMFEVDEAHLAMDAMLSSIVHIAATTVNPHKMLDEVSEAIIASKTNGFLKRQEEYIQERFDLFKARQHAAQQKGLSEDLQKFEEKKDAD